MSNKKRSHNNKARNMLSWAGKIFILVMVSLILLLSFALFWITYYVFKEGYVGWSLLLLLAGILLFIIGALMMRSAIRIPRISQGLELKEDGIYQYHINFGRQETTERFVLYDQIERIYLGPSAIKIHNQPSYYIAVRIVWEWTENDKKAYASVTAETQEQLEDVMNRFSIDVPIKTTEIDLNNFPNNALPLVFSSSELAELKERDPLVLPFPAFRSQFGSGPQWEPPEVKEKRKNRYEKLDRYGTFFFRLSLIYCFLYSLIYIPDWHMTDEQFDDGMMFIFPIPLMLPLIIFFYMREKMIIKRVIKQDLYILAAYLLGGLGGTLINGLGIIYFITIVEYGTYLLITLAITYIIVKAIWWFFYGIYILLHTLILENFNGKRGSKKGESKAENVKSG